MTDPKTIARYLKILALVEQGVGNEADNARKILKGLEEKHPGIRAAAEAVRQAQTGSPTGAGGAAGGWDWMNILKEGFGAAASVASAMADAQRGSHLALNAEPYWKQTKSGNLVAGVRMPVNVMIEAQDLNEMQRIAFAREIHARVDEVLADLFEAETED